MSRTITIDVFNPASIDAAVKEIRAYGQWVQRKTAELTRRLADMGAVNVSLGFSRAVYTGNKDVSVTVEQHSDNSYSIVANGEAVAFIEFGAGVTYGYGHPNPTLNGEAMGPGTYPSDKGHWNDPNGWYIPGGEHTYGNPPSMPMYLTASELKQDLVDIAREVFASD